MVGPVLPVNTVNPLPAETLSVTLSETVIPQNTVSDSSAQMDIEVPPHYPRFTTLPPKPSSPIITNSASSSPSPALLPTPSLPPSTTPSLPSDPNTPSLPSTSTGPSPLPSSSSRQTATATPSLVEKLRAAEDKTLKRLAPITVSPTGRPRVLIPDAVFAKGAEIHKDFIICYYNGKAPPFNQIQSVFNHLWGKGMKLEIHNNPINRTTIVRIQSEYIRQKILEKCVWYVGDTMFHTALWSEVRSSSAPPIKSLRLWAHLTGVPLDLRHQAGLSLVAGLVGEPKETDDFTKNMVSLTLSHVKVKVNLTQPLPSVVEFERESGEVVEVDVHYPWVPPTCSHCKELGHIIRNCLHYTPPPKASGDPPAATQKTPKTSKKKQTQIYRPVPPTAGSLIPASQNSSFPSSSSTVITPPPLNPLPLPPIQSTDPISNHLPIPMDSSFSSPNPIKRPSLKRSRSSPTLSPPSSYNPNPNPFVHPLALPSPFLPPLKPSTVSLTSNQPISTSNPFALLPDPDSSSHPVPESTSCPPFLVPKDPPPHGDPPLISQ